MNKFLETEDELIVPKNFNHAIKRLNQTLFIMLLVFQDWSTSFFNSRDITL